MIRIIKLGLAFITCALILSGIFVYAASADDGSLRSYDIDKSRDIWMAEDPSSYIIPNNTIVQEYADRLYIDEDGWIKYKNETQVWARNQDGSILYTNKVFKNNYIYDYEQFGSGNFAVGEDNDYWANPDYYLTHGLQGDCEDIALALVSMMRSGNISVVENGTYIPVVINATLNMGYYLGYRHAWVEYDVYDTVFVYSSVQKEQRPFETLYYFHTWYVVTDYIFKGAML